MKNIGRQRGHGRLGNYLRAISPRGRPESRFKPAPPLLDRVPVSVQPGMKADQRAVWATPDRAAAEKAIAVFAEKYAAKCSRQVDCLTRDHTALLAFFDFNTEHWDHLRTSNPR
jgi:transposase-like protein